MKAHITIRSVCDEDDEQLRTIYNWAVLNTTATFDVVERTSKQQQSWIDAHDGQPYEAFVAVAEATGRIAGYASLSAISNKQGYRRTVENSVYVHPEWHGQGVGAMLLQTLVAAARKQDFTTIVALISADNEASLRLHRRLGFVDAGLLRRVGWKFGREIDVAYLQLFLDGPRD